MSGYCDIFLIQVYLTLKRMKSSDETKSIIIFFAEINS